MAKLHTQIILSYSTEISALLLFPFLSLDESLLLGSSLRAGEVSKEEKAEVMKIHISCQPKRHSPPFPFFGHFTL